MSVWQREDDLTYVADMSDLSHNPVHPETGAVITDAEFRRCLTPHIDGGELKWWYGRLDNGAYVLIYND